MTLIKITKKRLLVLIGILTVLSPFLGLPGLVKSAIIVILGLSVAGVALKTYDKKLCECENCIPKVKTGSYVENAPSTPSLVAETPKQEKEKKSENNTSVPIRI